MTNSIASNQGVKAHYIRTPRQNTSAFELFILGVGLLVSFILFGALAAYLWSAIDRRQSGYDSALIFIVLFAFLGSVVFLVLYQHWRAVRTRRWKPLRYRRLKRICQMPEVQQRLPHRLVEWHMRTPPLSRRTLAKHLSCIPPGHVVCANLPRADWAPKPRATDVDFEPIDLMEDTDQLSWLITLQLETNYREKPSRARPADENKDREGTLRGLLSALISWGGIVVTWGMILYFVYRSVITGRPDFFIYLLIASIGIAWIMNIFFEKKWWIVPGGLIYRETRFGRRDRGYLFRAAQHPLFIDMRDGFAVLIANGRAHRIECKEAASYALLAGWISRARTPTLGEVRVFLGLSVEVS